jgi:hypothetical protein
MPIFLLYFRLIPSFADIFPESIVVAYNAIMLERAKRANQLVALGAWKANMTMYTEELLNGALSAYRALWPG